MSRSQIGASLLIVVVIVSVVVPSNGSAASLVNFASADAPPTPFQVRAAKAAGRELKTVPGIPLRGLMARPEGEGPFAAVVLVHGCDGVRPY